MAGKGPLVNFGIQFLIPITGKYVTGSILNHRDTVSEFHERMYFISIHEKRVNDYRLYLYFSAMMEVSVTIPDNAG